jgi:hypothetical protein
LIVLGRQCVFDPSAHERENGKAKTVRTISRVQHQSERTVKSEAYDSKKKKKTKRMNDCGRRQTVREVESKEDETRKVGEPRSELYLEPTCHRVQCNQGATPVWEPILAAPAMGPKMDPRRVTRLVERTAVGEGERD